MSFLKNLLTKLKAHKLIVIGLDGTPYTFLKRIFSEGGMPTLNSLFKEGYFKQMNSIIPTISSVAWSSASSLPHPFSPSYIPKNGPKRAER